MFVYIRLLIFFWEARELPGVIAGLFVNLSFCKCCAFFKEEQSNFQHPEGLKCPTYSVCRTTLYKQRERGGETVKRHREKSCNLIALGASPGL